MSGILVLALAASGCFPHNAKHRRIAKISEGVSIATGIALNLAAAKNACMDRKTNVAVDQTCDDGVLDEIGLGLIFAGLVGFAATAISGMPDSSDVPEQVQEDSPPIVVTTPQMFCAAIYARDIVQAEAALNTFIRSQGVLRAFDAMVVLHAWLSRQGCVTVTSDIDVSSMQIDIVVRERRQEQYTVDTTDPGRIFLHVGMHTDI